MNVTTILIIVNVFTAIAIIALVLMQQSKGDMGSAFGGGGSQSMFGSRGSANFLSRCTSIMVAVFFISSLSLAFIYAKRNAAEQVVAPISVEESSEIPSIDDADAPTSNEIPVIEADAIDSSVPELPAEVNEAVDAAAEEPVEQDVPELPEQ